MSRSPLHQRLIAIIEPVLEGSGYELVDLRFTLEQGGWTLRVCADLPLDQAWSADDVSKVPEDRVDLEDCEQISRELSAVLDVDDPIPQAYALEVSSPGIDRPLRTAKHFAHFTGAEAKIQMSVGLQVAGSERRNFKGTLQGVDGAAVKIACDGQTFALPIDDIDSAKLVPDWDAVMRGKSGVKTTADADAPKPIKPGHRPSQKQKHKKQSAKGAD
jgi:ribosome maturation factor RimP